MCIFHVRSSTHSFKAFLEDHPELPVYQQHEKGEVPKIRSEQGPHQDYGFSCEVSDRPWDSVAGQVVDMISFLEVYTPHLQALQDSHAVEDWRFDLPYECRLDEQTHGQFDYLSPKLIRLAGALNIGIELSLYWPSDEEE